MFVKIKNYLKAYFRNYCLMMGAMSLPALVIDLIYKTSDSRFFWLVFAFSAIVPILNVIYDSFNLFSENMILRRVVFFVIIVTVLMAFSWNMGLIASIPVLLLGIGCCIVVGVPLMIILGIRDRKHAETLNAKLQEYKNKTLGQNSIDKVS